MDGSQEAKHALTWVLQHVFRADADYLDLVSIATLTEPFVSADIRPMTVGTTAQQCHGITSHLTAQSDTNHPKGSLLPQGLPWVALEVPDITGANEYTAGCSYIRGKLHVTMPA